MKCKICGDNVDLLTYLLWHRKCYYCDEAEKEVLREKSFQRYKDYEKRKAKMINERKKYFR